MKQKLKIYGSGIITGFWILFIVLNISIKLGKFEINSEYPIYKLIIGVCICLGFTLFSLFNRDLK
jgi:hypothetical protein